MTLITDKIPSHMWHPDNGPIRGQDSSLWPMTAQGTGHSLIMRVGGPGPDSLWLWPVGAGQIICLVKTKTKPHVMVHKYNLSKLHLHHQLWFQLESSILKLTLSSKHDSFKLTGWYVVLYGLRLFWDAQNLEICSFYGPHIGIWLKTVWIDL